MRRSLRTMLGAIGMAAAALGGSGGCAVGLDLFSDDLFANLGLDVTSLRGPTGRSIVNLRNETEFPVTFNVIVGENPDALEEGIEEIERGLAPGDSRNITFSCGVNFATLGVTDDDFAYTPLAAVVTEADGNVDVNYAGTALVNGEDFFCGNVIDITIDEAPVGDDDEADVNYVIRVRIIRGR
ncbi:MAG: hypothetical protein SF069_02845 [Phycisphaerae bacterium]|nr:hypothetical protein [Phycisphaerae bacterium]